MGVSASSRSPTSLLPARRYLEPFLILSVGWLALLLYAYPGYMSYDSVVQLSEARSGVFTDWHPPLMALVWRWADRIHSGPIGMLLLQLTLFTAGTFSLLGRMFSSRTAAILATALLVFPPIGTTLGVVWKDSLMLGALVAGTAMMLSERKAIRIASAVPFIFATALRHNAFTATFFLVVLLFRWSLVSKGLRRYAPAAAFWVVTILAAQLINVTLTDQKTHPWHGSVALFDIVGTIRFAPPIADEQLKRVLDGASLIPQQDIQAKAISAYSPIEGHFRVLNNGFLPPPWTAEQRAGVTRAWRHLVSEYPAAYLRHRWHAYRDLLRLKKRYLQSVWVGFDAGSGVREYSQLQLDLQRVGLWVGSSWLTHPYLYLFLLIGLTPFLFRRDALLPATLTLSAITSELALYFISPTPDFRYSIWLVCCALLVPIMLIRIRYLRGNRDLC